MQSKSCREMETGRRGLRVGDRKAWDFCRPSGEPGEDLDWRLARFRTLTRRGPESATWCGIWRGTRRKGRRREQGLRALMQTGNRTSTMTNKKKIITFLSLGAGGG